MASAAIAATYRIIEEEGLVEQVERRSQIVFEALNARVGRGVREVRGLGYLIGVSCDDPAKEVQKRFLDEMILVGTSGSPDTFRLLPPLTVSDDEWEIFFAAMERVFR